MFGNIHETMQKCNPLKNNISVNMRFKETFSFFFFFFQLPTLTASVTQWFLWQFCSELCPAVTWLPTGSETFDVQ